MENFPIFISYSRKDIELVLPIRNAIEEAMGCKCWMDLKAIESGSKRFTKDIISGINHSKVLLFMLTENSQHSEFALRELDFADKKGKQIVIVNVNDCAMTDEFQFLYGLTDTISWSDIPQREKLLRDLKRWIAAEQPLSVTEQQNLEQERQASEAAEKARLEEERQRMDVERERLERERLEVKRKARIDASLSVVAPHVADNTVQEVRLTVPEMSKPEYVTPKSDDELAKRKWKVFFQKAWPWIVAFMVFELFYLIIVHLANNGYYGGYGNIGNGFAYGIVVSWPFVLLFAAFIWLAKRYSTKFKALPWVVIGLSTLICLLVHPAQKFGLPFLFSYLPLLMGLMSLAVLFVYRPKNFKTLPWIVLAVMGLTFFVMGLKDFYYAPLLWRPIGWGDFSLEPMTITSNPGYTIHRLFWIGKANLSRSSLPRFVVSAIPIIALWIVLILDVIRKKELKMKEDSEW